MKFSYFLLLSLSVLLITPIHGQEDDFDLEDLDEMIEDAEEDQDDASPPVTDVNPKVVYKPPTATGNVYLAETFDDEATFKKKWIVSEAKKDDADEDIAKYDGKWALEESIEKEIDGDIGLVLKSKARLHAISTKLNKPYKFDGSPLIVQYEVRFQDGQECGGAYVKLLTDNKQLDLKTYNDKMPYTIMFGPDKCGNDHKLHFIFRHKNPKTGEFEEKHAKKPTVSLDKFFTDKKTHLFTLSLFPDNTWEIFVDQELVNSGSLLEDMEPAVNPPEEIVDPDDKKPEDWDDKEKIPDPDAVKPEDWDESEPEMIEDIDAVKPDGWLDDEEPLIADPDAEKPSDWDDEMDGEWEAPMIDNPLCASAPGCGEWTTPQIKNPLYKGKWYAPKIDNPNYKGKWKPRMIKNPNYFEDEEPYKMTPFSALGLELWSISNNLLFDNFLIIDDKSVADKWAAESWKIKQDQEFRRESNAAQSVWDAIKSTVNEKPWILAVICIVVILPLVLLIAYCCSSGEKKPADIAERKKTDEATPDVDYDEDDASGDAPSKESPKPAKGKKKGKGALDAEPEEEAVAEEEEEEEVEEVPEETTRKSPRKRKPRKE
ncbi:unnamed protein product [Owenia fusiformis]|uniref:Uncharacterized protein n=1 Tax=Owenia fusiformis TaxID=6347 RepID=A0A8J1TH44_OWEFU|nr:unnamed protein product [Owenia fusiformis]